MANPDDLNNKNNPVKNKQKEGKEHLQKNDESRLESINAEAESNMSMETGPMSINYKSTGYSFAIANNMGMSGSSNKDSEVSDDSMGGMNSSKKGTDNGMGMSSDNFKGPNTSPKDVAPTAPKGETPEIVSSEKELVETEVNKDKDVVSETTSVSTDNNNTGGGDTPPEKTLPKKPVEQKKSDPVHELLELSDLSNTDSSEKGSDLEGTDNGGEVALNKAKSDIASELSTSDSTQKKEGETGSGESTTASNIPSTTTNTAEETDALKAFDVQESDEEAAESSEYEINKKEGLKLGLMVGRSVGFGAKIEIGSEGKLSISKFSEDEEEAKTLKAEYIKTNDTLAKTIGDTGHPTPLKSGQTATPKPGYQDGYFQGYNWGHGEGLKLKKDAANAERAEKSRAEQGTEEYTAGKTLGYECGMASANGTSEIDTTFEIGKDADYKQIAVKTSLAEVNNAADKKNQTPGGEVSGPAYGKAFTQYYNMGYMEVQNKKKQGPERDEDFMIGHELGYKYGIEKAKGGAVTPALKTKSDQHDAENTSQLAKKDLQQNIGFYAGYNKGYTETVNGKRNKATEERKKKYADPIFMSGFATGHLKGFLEVIIRPSGIALLEALGNAKRMESAGIPSYFPIPDVLRENIKATLLQGDAKAGAKSKNPTAILLSKPLFQEGLLMGYNQGYLKGEQSSATFKRDKHKMHPDYQKAIKPIGEKKAPDTEPGSSGGPPAKIDTLTLGQVLGKAQFAMHQLLAKKTPSEEEKVKLEKLSKGIKKLNAQVSGESKFYQLGISDHFNWQYAQLEKEQQAKNTQYDYDGEEGSARWRGFQWGLKVGENVVKSKEKLKDFKRKGRSIGERQKQLNAAIKKSETAAKIKAKNPNEGEEYFVGYTNGYNFAFLKAREAKKSEAEKMKVEVDREAGKTIGKGFNDFNGPTLEAVKSVIDLKGNNEVKKSFDDIGAQSFKGEKLKAFEAGAAQGHNLGYSKMKFDPDLGKISSIDANGRIEEKEEQLYEGYTKALKNRHSGYKKVKVAGKEGGAALGLLYFFIEGFQYYKSYGTFGAPKGIIDALSYNLGCKDATDAIAKEAEAANATTNAKDVATPAVEKKKAGSEESYNAGYQAIYNKAHFDAFKSSVFTAITSSDNKTKEGEETTTTDSFGGLSALKAEEERAKAAAQKEEDAKRANANVNHQDGSNDANLLWSKIIYINRGIKLENELPEKIEIVRDGKVDVLDNSTAGEDLARALFYDKEASIDALVDTYVKGYIESHNELKTQKYRLLEGENEARTAFENKISIIRENYKSGYVEKIAAIESEYNEKYMNAWLHDFGYYLGATLVYRDLELEIPSAPYEEMSSKDIDYESPYYLDGHTEGMKFGVRAKNGLVELTDEVLAKASGADYYNGFEEGKKFAQDLGEEDASDKERDALTEEDLIEEIENRLENDSGSMHYDYQEGFLKAFYPAYWATRNFVYGKTLGIKRSRLGANGMVNSEPEDGVHIEDKAAFLNGFNQGREDVRKGIDEESTITEKFKGMIDKDAWKSASVAAIEEYNLTEKVTNMLASEHKGYDPYKKLKVIKAFAGPDKSEINLGMSSNSLPPEEQEAYDELFSSTYQDRYDSIYSQCMVELMNIALLGPIAPKKSTDGTEEVVTTEENTVTGVVRDALDYLGNLLFGDDTLGGGTGDEFFIDRIRLLEMFYELEIKTEETQDEIEGDLEDIEWNKSLANIIQEEDIDPYESEMKQLELDLQDESLKPKDRNPKKARLNKLRIQLKGKHKKLTAIEKKWMDAEKAAKQKIEGIRLFMEEKLAFDTPLESNEDILEYIKINLQTSQEPEEEVYDQIDIFNDLVLKGSFNYQESSSADVLVLGAGNLYLDHYAENVHIENADVFIKENGFEFAAKGLSYTKSSHEMMLFSGTIVTPRIEGGAHEGKKYQYSFNDFNIYLEQGMKSQIEDQKYKLKGGDA